MRFSIEDLEVFAIAFGLSGATLLLSLPGGL